MSDTLTRINDFVRSSEEFFQRKEIIIQSAQKQLGYKLELCSINPEPVIDIPYNGKKHLWFPNNAIAYLEVKMNGCVYSAFFFQKEDN